MAQLKDTLIQGSARVTDTLYTNKILISQVLAPTASNGTTFGAGINNNVLKSNGTLVFWGTLGKAEVGLGNVENTALSSWAGSTNITKLGTITSGTWHGSTLGVAYGGTGKTSWTQWGVLYASATTTLANTAAGTAGYLLQGNGSAAPSWIQATNANTASTVVKRDASGNFSAGTITATLSGTATNATTAGKISNLTTSDAASSTTTARRIWFSYNDNVTGRPAYDDNFTYTTNGGILKVNKIITTGTGLRITSSNNSYDMFFRNDNTWGYCMINNVSDTANWYSYIPWKVNFATGKFYIETGLVFTNGTRRSWGTQAQRPSSPTTGEIYFQID